MPYMCEPFRVERCLPAEIVSRTREVYNRQLYYSQKRQPSRPVQVKTEGFMCGMWYNCIVKMVFIENMWSLILVGVSYACRVSLATRLVARPVCAKPNGDFVLLYLLRHAHQCRRLFFNKKMLKNVF